ncbi:MAG: hypothetical protein AAGA69_04375, partial [Pseudomonadota bacterium]
ESVSQTKSHCSSGPVLAGTAERGEGSAIRVLQQDDLAPGLLLTIFEISAFPGEFKIGFMGAFIILAFVSLETVRRSSPWK